MPDEQVLLQHTATVLLAAEIWQHNILQRDIIIEQSLENLPGDDNEKTT